MFEEFAATMTWNKHFSVGQAVLVRAQYDWGKWHQGVTTGAAFHGHFANADYVPVELTSWSGLTLLENVVPLSRELIEAVHAHVVGAMEVLE